MQDHKKGALSINKSYAEKVMTVEFDAQASLQNMTRASENMIYKSHLLMKKALSLGGVTSNRWTFNDV